jgi:thiol-disulfide isomerase/thioredoxin
MKLKSFFIVIGLALLPTLALAEEGPPLPAPTADLQALVNRIGTKIKAGEKTAEALAPELKEFEALEAKYRDQKTDEVARIHFMHALLYVQVFGDVERGKQILGKIQADFPATNVGAAAGQAITTIEQRAATENAKNALAGKPAPELDFAWATRDGLTKLSDLKGKVVVIDFWATWCGPCVASFPNVRELTAHYQGLDVVVLGVTSLQGRVHGLQSTPIDTRNDPQKEFALMRDYIKAKDITWTVAFSEQEVFNPDYGVTGIPHMVIIAPDGTVRHPDMDPRDPHEEKIAKIDALLKEFGKPTAK